jgi:hypothetical protein
MRESSRATKLGAGRRNVCSLHRRKLCATFIALVIMDNAIPYTLPGRFLNSIPLNRSLLSLWIFVEFIVGTAYIYETSKYVWPLRKWISHPESNPHQENVEKFQTMVRVCRMNEISWVGNK